jgi:hypothetical protein
MSTERGRSNESPNIDELEESIETQLIQVVRRSVAIGVREVLDDLKKQQRDRARFVSLADAEPAYGISKRKLLTFIRTGKLTAYGPGRDLGTQGKLLLATDELESFIRSYQVAVSDLDIEKIANEVTNRTMSPSVGKAKPAPANGSGTIRGRRLRGS